MQNKWNGSGKIKWIGSTPNKLTGSSSFRNGSDSQELAVKGSETAITLYSK